MSCCNTNGTVPRDINVSALSAQKAFVCNLCAGNVDVRTLNGVAIERLVTANIETGTYLPTVTSQVGYTQPVQPFPATFQRVENVVTVTGILLVTNTGVNQWASAVLTTPPSLPPSPTSFARGSGSFWNQTIDAATGVVTAVHMQQEAAEQVRLSNQQLSTDGVIAYSFSYTV